MFNQVRTLLLNANSSESRSLNFPGEDPVPANFRAIAVSEPLLAIRRVLFGSNPDRAYINWRLRQYLTLLHRSRLSDHMTADDKRITYWPYDRPLGSDCVPALGVTIDQTYGDMTMGVLGAHDSDDANGRLLWTGIVNVENGVDYSIECEVPKRAESSGVLTFSSGLSAPVAIPGSAAKLVFSEVFTARPNRFNLTMLAQPSKNIAAILKDLISLLGERANGRCAEALFGTADIEPYKTYKQLWINSYSSMRLGAVLLALAKRTGE